MRAYRVALSILLLIALAISAPSVIHARLRGRDVTAGLADLDDQPDVPVTFDVPDVSVAAAIETFAIVDLTVVLVRPGARATPILASAPKTSPPLV